MTDFTRMTSADAAWMIDDVGEEIDYSPQGGAATVRFHAIIDRNAESQPAFGHVGSISTKHHEMTFMRLSLPVKPRKGDLIEIVDKQQNFDADQYRVEHVLENDEDCWTVVAR